MIILFYGVIVTALPAIATPKLMEGAIKFIVYWFQALVDFDANVIGFGNKVANMSSLIPDPTASGIIFWVLLILISVIVIRIVYLTIYSGIILYVRYLKENQFDKYTVIADITALAFTILLANVIKVIAPINLFAFQIGLFLAYSGIRALVARKNIKNINPDHVLLWRYMVRIFFICEENYYRMRLIKESISIFIFVTLVRELLPCLIYSQDDL